MDPDKDPLRTNLHSKGPQVQSDSDPRPSNQQSAMHEDMLIEVRTSFRLFRVSVLQRFVLWISTSESKAQAL